MISRTAFTIIALLGVALVVSSCGKLDQGRVRNVEE